MTMTTLKRVTFNWAELTIGIVGIMVAHRRLGAREQEERARHGPGLNF